ncbi:SufE family protein [Umboniibacter marinipuniceus]|uniref:Cysteine desulfuration protein SufE n=1 Tax=Umboniibacter marinipuniceus TaxID=569599 RepID=A0A3M0A5I5_9GAMM|nr:SufE family protein [Umboniibacter marinipuniceus]RMA78769.1 cysteine desulfuration protein SufE [Umboniibacter marinipuniceus]
MNLTTDEIIDDLEFFDDWEERYKYIIDLGKELPEFDDAYRLDENLVKGCQSSVWLHSERQNGVFRFSVDSDAIIVRGLLALVLAAFDEKTAAQITSFDIDGYFAEIDLENHLSPTRGNGLRAIVGKIKALAEVS